jgi:hypothetical protein
MRITRASGEQLGRRVESGREPAVRERGLARGVLDVVLLGVHEAHVARAAREEREDLVAVQPLHAEHVRRLAEQLFGEPARAVAREVERAAGPLRRRAGRALGGGLVVAGVGPGGRPRNPRAASRASGSRAAPRAGA